MMPEQRAPLCADDYLKHKENKDLAWALGYKEASDFYENLITSGELIPRGAVESALRVQHDECSKWQLAYLRQQSGELMVVKTVKRSELTEHYRTEHNISFAASGISWNTHCAGCGAIIVE